MVFTGHQRKGFDAVGQRTSGCELWTEQNGDIVLLLAKSDAYTDMGRLGRIRLHVTPAIFDTPRRFTQTLRMDHGDIELQSPIAHVRVWIDANRPDIPVEYLASTPIRIEASLETWRKDHNLHGSLEQQVVVNLFHQ